MQFGNKSIGLHLVRGALGFGAVAGSLATMNHSLWPTLILMPVALYALKGCPVCWTVGLFETIAFRLHERMDELDQV